MKIAILLPTILFFGFLLAACEGRDEATSNDESGDQTSADTESAVHSETLITPVGPITFIYKMDDGQAYFEGDILLDLDDLRAQAEQDMADPPPATAVLYGATTSGLAARRQAKFLWPDATVPFKVSTPGAWRGIIDTAINELERTSPLRFVERTTGNQDEYPDYVDFVEHDKKCASKVGRQRDRQTIKLSEKCVDGGVIHELGHTVGLFHEHTRSDRDDYVIVYEDNIDDNDSVFERKDEDELLWWVGREGSTLGPYDFQSVMHYGSFAFANAASGSCSGPGTCTGEKLCLTSNLCRGPTVMRRFNCTGQDCFIRPNRRELTDTDRNYLHQLYCRMLNWPADRCGNYFGDFKSPYWRIEEVRPGLSRCIDVEGGSRQNQANVNVFRCHGGRNQYWLMEDQNNGEFAIRNGHSRLCLDVPGFSTGFVRLQQYACNGGANQLWRLRRLPQNPDLDFKRLSHAEYQVISVHSELCLGVNASAQLVMTECSNSRLFRFIVHDLPRNNWELRAKSTDQCIDVPHSSTNEDVLIQEFPCHGDENQRFRLISRNNNAFAVAFRHSDLCIGISGDTVMQARVCGDPWPTSGEPTHFHLFLMHDGSLQFRQVDDSVINLNTCLTRGSGTPLLTAAECSLDDGQRWNLRDIERN